VAPYDFTSWDAACSMGAQAENNATRRGILFIRTRLGGELLR
jgi:hypothetical protein